MRGRAAYYTPPTAGLYSCSASPRRGEGLGVRGRAAGLYSCTALRFIVSIAPISAGWRSSDVQR